MAVLVAKKVEDFFNSLVMRAKVLSLSNNGTNTTLSLDNVYNARALPESNRRNVAIDGVDYPIVAVDYSANTIEVVGVIASASEAIFPNPTFLAGSLQSASIEFKVQRVNDIDNLPMVYLNDPIMGERPQAGSIFEKTAKINLAFIDVYNSEWLKRSNHYEDSCQALANYSEFVDERLRLYGRCLTPLSAVKDVIVPRWGKIERKGTKEKIFDYHLDAVEFSVDVGVCNCP